MNLGTVLVLVGTILVLIDLLIGLPGRTWVGTGKLLAVGVILIGIGVLCGPEVLVK